MYVSPILSRASTGVTCAHRESTSAPCSSYGLLSTSCSSRTTEKSPSAAAS